MLLTSTSVFKSAAVPGWTFNEYQHSRKPWPLVAMLTDTAFKKQNTLTLKIVRPTLLFYIVAAATIFGLEKFSPSGPCTPGLGVLSFFLLIPITVGLLLHNIYLTLKVDKRNRMNVIIHSVAIIILFAIMW